MSEFGIAEYFSKAEALGIIATLFVILYFSRKQMQSLSVDIETKILNDLDDKIYGITQMGVEQPELIKVISNVQSNFSPDVAYAYHILFTFAHGLILPSKNLLIKNYLMCLKNNLRDVSENHLLDILRSDLSRALRNTFHSTLASLNEGIVLPMEFHYLPRKQLFKY